MHNLHNWVMVAVGRMLTVSREDLKRQEGQGATEYGIVIAFVVVTLTITVGLLGTAITGFLGKVAAQLDGLLP